MSFTALSKEECERTIAALEEVIAEGFTMGQIGGHRGVTGAMEEASKRLGIARMTLRNRLATAEREHGMKPDLTPPKRPFAFDELPDDGEPDAETLIAALKEQSAKRQAHDDAKKLYQVSVNIDGPIGIAFFGDPHVDSAGTDWVSLERDVSLCKGAEGVLAVCVGDLSDNWVGRLMALYANADVTAKQSLKLIEWLLTSLPWLVTIGGNHDLWHTETADPIEIIHRLKDMPGLYQGSGCRLQLNLPSGCSATMHVRHDFPGNSMFNPGHALVRETLFGYRDHILACGHRHQSGHVNVWHNDPKRLCQGIRLGSYKVIDSFAHEKHFKQENWAKAMMAVIDPMFANDPVRYIKTCYSIEEGTEYLAWRRESWRNRKVAA